MRDIRHELPPCRLGAAQLGDILQHHQPTRGVGQSGGDDLKPAAATRLTVRHVDQVHGGLARRRGADKLDQLGVAHGFRQRVTAGERSSEQPRGSRVAQYDPFVGVEDAHAVCQVL